MGALLKALGLEKKTVITPNTPAPAPAPSAPAPAPKPTAPTISDALDQNKTAIGATERRAREAGLKNGGDIDSLRGFYRQKSKASGKEVGVDLRGFIHGPGGIDKVPARVNETGEEIRVGAGERIVNPGQNAALERLVKKETGRSLDTFLEKATGHEVGPTMREGVRHAMNGFAPEVAARELQPWARSQLIAEELAAASNPGLDAARARAQAAAMNSMPWQPNSGPQPRSIPSGYVDAHAQEQVARARAADRAAAEAGLRNAPPNSGPQPRAAGGSGGGGNATSKLADARARFLGKNTTSISDVGKGAKELAQRALPTLEGAGKLVGSTTAGFGIEGAVRGLGTGTEEYAERMGVDVPQSFLGDLALRTAGVASDVGASAFDLAALPYNVVKHGADFKNWYSFRDNFADVASRKQQAAAAAAGETQQAGPSAEEEAAAFDAQRNAAEKGLRQREQLAGMTPSAGAGDNTADGLLAQQVAYLKNAGVGAYKNRDGSEFTETGPETGTIDKRTGLRVIRGSLDGETTITTAGRDKNGQLVVTGGITGDQGAARMREADRIHAQSARDARTAGRMEARRLMSSNNMNDRIEGATIQHQMDKAEYYDAMDKQNARLQANSDRTYDLGLRRLDMENRKYGLEQQNKAAIEDDRQYKAFMDKAGVHFSMPEMKDGKPTGKQVIDNQAIREFREIAIPAMARAGTPFDKMDSARQDEVLAQYALARRGTDKVNQQLSGIRNAPVTRDLVEPSQMRRGEDISLRHVWDGWTGDNSSVGFGDWMKSLYKSGDHDQTRVVKIGGKDYIMPATAISRDGDNVDLDLERYYSQRR